MNEPKKTTIPNKETSTHKQISHQSNTLSSTYSSLNWGFCSHMNNSLGNLTLPYVYVCLDMESPGSYIKASIWKFYKQANEFGLWCAVTVLYVETVAVYSYSSEL